MIRGIRDGSRRAPNDYPVVLFDLDGTLVDTIGLILSSFQHATGSVLGSVPSDETLLKDVGIPLVQQMANLSPEHADELVAVYREHNARVHDDLIREYPGVDDALASLSMAGKRMGIVTSKARPLAHRAMDLFGMSRYFEHVVTFEDVSNYKPDPEPLYVAASAMGVSAADCIYVGDSPHDVNAALSAGSLAVGASWGVAGPERVAEPGPHYVVDTMGELVELLLGR